MAARDGLVDFLRDQLAPLGLISPRRMFGVTGLFCEGVMFGVIAEDALYLRRVPDRLFDEPDELAEWARAGLAAAHRVAGSRPR
jgi:DNA transformation protein